MKHKLQKVDIDQLQDQRKKTPPPETKDKFKMGIEMVLVPAMKKLGQLKQKPQTPIGQAGRVHTNTEVISERPGDI